MNSSKLLAFSVLAVLLLVTAVKADIAPPMININVTYNGHPINGTFNISALVCTNNPNINASQFPKVVPSYDAAKGCYWALAEPLHNIECGAGWCGLYYFPSTDLKLALYLPALGETFVTNEFNQSSFTTEYYAELYSNGSATISSGPIYSNTTTTILQPPIPVPPITYILFVLALLLTLAIELTAAFLYLRAARIKKKRRILATVIAANIISVPVLWFLFIYFLAFTGFVLGEIFAILFEGAFVYFFNKKWIRLKSAMIMSLIMNLTSLILGGIILFLLNL
jgi:hypothetical protein